MHFKFTFVLTSTGNLLSVSEDTNIYIDGILSRFCLMFYPRMAVNLHSPLCNAKNISKLRDCNQTDIDYTIKDDVQCSLYSLLDVSWFSRTFIILKMPPSLVKMFKRVSTVLAYITF